MLEKLQQVVLATLLASILFVILGLILNRHPVHGYNCSRETIGGERYNVCN